MSGTEIKRAKARSFDDVPNKQGGSNLKYASEVFDLLDLSKSDGKFVPIRFIGGLVAYTMHWVSIQKRDGEWTNIPKICLSYDPETLEFDPKRRCPYCEAAAKFRSMEITVKVKGRNNNPVSTNTDYLYNAINRELQEEITPKIATREERDTGFKNKDSKSRTPVQVVRLTKSLANKLKDLKNLNVHLVSVKGKGGESKKSRVAQDLSHPKYGIDVFLKYDSKVSDAASTYSVQKDNVTPLTEEELEYLRWDIEAFPYMNEPESEEEADASIASFGGKCWEAITGKKKRKVEEVEYDDDDEDIEDDYAEDEEDEEEDEPPRKSKKAPAKSKRKVVEEDDDDEDDDEDDEPPRKSKSKSKSKRKVVDEDEDEDEEEDEPPRKSKKAPAKSKRKVVEEDEDEVDLDDLDDLDDDEEEDEPPRKSKKAPAKSTKRKVDDDDDDLPF